MQHRHSVFCDTAEKKAWSAPVLTSNRLSPGELDALRASPEMIAAFGARLRAEGRI